MIQTFLLMNAAVCLLMASVLLGWMIPKPKNAPGRYVMANLCIATLSGGLTFLMYAIKSVIV